MPDCQANQALAMPDLTVAGAAARAAAVCISSCTYRGPPHPILIHIKNIQQQQQQKQVEQLSNRA